MQESVLSQLRSRRTEILNRWESLLRIEPIHTPLANPDALVHLMGITLDEVLASLASNGLVSDRPPAQCHCGKHPLLSYFRAGQQALLESLVLVQAGDSKQTQDERNEALRRLKCVLNDIIWREIGDFQGVCRHHAERRNSGT